MSLYSAMLAGVSGLQSNSTALAAISENIANVNTVGYKNASIDFQTLVTNSANTGDYSAGGVATSNQQFVTQQGSTTQTSSPTDLAIVGQGMFVVNNQPTTPGTGNGSVLFTRAGSFTTDSSGYLENSAGLYLMGWPADANGDITTSASTSSLQPININALSGAVSPTTTAAITGNLNSSQPVSAGLAAYDPSTNSMTAYDASTNTGTKPDFTIQIPVSDSQGGQHTLQIDLLKTNTPNVWDAEIQSVPPGQIVSATGVAGQLAAGQIAFNPDGSINTAATTLNTNLTILPSNNTTPLTGAQAQWASSLGINGQTIDVDISGATSAGGGLTQLASASSVRQVTANGTPFGNLSSVSVDKNGIVTATFDNGTSRQIAQVAMATFPNEDGLLATNGNAYQATSASGGFNLTTAGAGGAGQIASSALEASTVDLSTEFTNLITTQSAYSAASKVITTADNMTQALLAMIQG